MSQPRHSVSVAAVIPDDQGRVLVIQRRDNGAWQLPGGILEMDETIENGVRREVQEETGVTIEPVRLTGIYKNMKLGVVALVFRAQLVNGTPHPTEESAAIDWWTADRVAAEMNETF
ncbi:MAG TPA: NUDIX domain-containing protein, partial [Micromonospora sp.]